MKDTVYQTLKTPYIKNMNPDLPWDVYPRPAFVRNSYFSLNGKWDFKISDTSDIPLEYSEKILVPFPPESELSGIGKTPGKYEFLHYKRTFTLPAGFNKGKLLLRFGAVDRLATVSVNGTVVGTHNDGYLPFFADVTSLVKEGENEIYLKVKDNLSPLFPYGKQKKKRGGMWYTPVSGIWQTVWLESVPEGYIENIRIEQSMTEAKITVIGGVGKKTLTLKDSGEVYAFDGDSVTVRPSDGRLWSPEDPYLYYFTIKTQNDEIESYFALREVGICYTGATSRLTLNGKPYLFNGLLDQGYYPDGIFTPPSPECYEDDILLAKKLGFNTLRKHIKLEPAIFYHLCDKLGIAVFQDMINNSKYSFIRDTALPTIGLKSKPDKHSHKNALSRKAFEYSMKGIMNTLYNYPSVVYFTIFNEGWGQFAADEMYDKAKAIDPSRIIDATSGWFHRKRSDVNSLHIYFRPLKAKDDGRPLVISEFGGYSHRVDGHLFGSKNYGYTSYPSAGEFERAVCKLYDTEVRELVRAGASAFIYTQVSDVEDETNGFITYDRQVVKVDAEKVSGIMRSLTEDAEAFGKEDMK